MFKENEIIKIMNEKLNSDEIKKYIESKVVDSIKDSINEQFSTWKSKENSGHMIIKNAVDNAIGLNLDKIKIPDFQSMLINTINQSLKNSITKEAKENLDYNLKKLLITDKEELTLKELILSFLESEHLLEDYMKAANDEYYSCSCEDINLKAEDLEIDYVKQIPKLKFELIKDDNSSNFLWININIDKYNIRLYKYDNRWNLSSISGVNSDIFKDNTIYKSLPYGFELLLFKIYNGSCKINITQEELDNYFEK